jgi:hypothetical protein
LVWSVSTPFPFRYYYAWGSHFVTKQGLLWLAYNYFAAGHGKGMCDSEGGNSKQQLSKAILSGVNLRTSKELFKYLKKHCCDVGHRTAGGIYFFECTKPSSHGIGFKLYIYLYMSLSHWSGAKHSPSRREFHYCNEGNFLQYHPLHLPNLAHGIQCHHSFVIERKLPFQ